MLRAVLLVLLLGSVVATPTTAPEIRWEKTEGLLEGSTGAWLLQTPPQAYLLAFDDKYEKWPEVKERLPKMVGQLVIVEHRQGVVEFGKHKVLLARDLKKK